MEIRLFRSWNNIPRAQIFKPKFEFQTSLARDSPVGTSELLPFGANSDLTWDWRFPEIILGDYSLLSPVGFYYASTLLGNYTNGEMVKRRNEYFPVGVYHASTFLGNYIDPLHT